MNRLLVLAIGLWSLSGAALADPRPPHATPRPAAHLSVRPSTPGRAPTRATVHVRPTVQVRLPARRAVLHRPTAHQHSLTRHGAAVVHARPTLRTHAVVVKHGIRAPAKRPSHAALLRFRKVVHAPHRYHAAQAWVPPRGFTYRRFSIGERIPFALLAAPYFLSNFSLYSLDAPPYGYVWVRDGDDAVLVDQETGEVIQVVYDVFY